MRAELVHLFREGIGDTQVSGCPHFNMTKMTVNLIGESGRNTCWRVTGDTVTSFTTCCFDVVVLISFLLPDRGTLRIQEYFFFKVCLAVTLRKEGVVDRKRSPVCNTLGGRVQHGESLISVHRECRTSSGVMTSSCACGLICKGRISGMA